MVVVNSVISGPLRATIYGYNWLFEDNHNQMLTYDP